MIVGCEIGFALAVAAWPIIKWVGMRLVDVGIYVAADLIIKSAEKYPSEDAASEPVPQTTVDYLLATDVKNYEIAAKNHLTGLAQKSMLTLVEGTKHRLSDPETRPTRLEVDVLLNVLWSAWEEARAGKFDAKLPGLQAPATSSSVAMARAEATSTPAWLLPAAIAIAGAGVLYLATRRA